MSACCAGERAGIYVRNVSSNGTYLNDSLLEGSRLLAHGDQVQIKNKAQADMFRSVLRTTRYTARLDLILPKLNGMLLCAYRRFRFIVSKGK